MLPDSILLEEGLLSLGLHGCYLIRQVKDLSVQLTLSKTQLFLLNGHGCVGKGMLEEGLCE